MTVAQIEDGLGCTPPVEIKICLALRVIPGTIWNEFKGDEQYHHSKVLEQRWRFQDFDQGRKYMESYGLENDLEQFHLDIDAIQDETERYRIGRIGLADAFSKTLGRRLSKHNIASQIIERFKLNEVPALPDAVSHIQCLKGSLLITLQGEEFDLEERDVFIVERDLQYGIQPALRLSMKELPVVYSQVTFSAHPHRRLAKSLVAEPLGSDLK
jgi:hypothetical protein